MFRQIFFLSIIFIIGCQSNSNKLDNIEFTKTDTNINFDTCYPYNIASFIKIISYPNRYLWDGKEVKAGGFLINSEILKNGKLNFDTTEIKEQILLNRSQLKSLFQILYNKRCEAEVSATCYDPRHLIVFYDKNNKAIEYIEICFDCLNIHTSKNVPIIETCNVRMDSISIFFKKNGIKYFGDFKTESKFFDNNKK